MNTSFLLQTITSAMSTLTPPVTLEDPANQSRMDYVLEVSSSPDFDYPSVSQPLFVLFALHVRETKRASPSRSRITYRPSRAQNTEEVFGTIASGDRLHLGFCFLNRLSEFHARKDFASRRKENVTNPVFSFASFARAMFTHGFVHLIFQSVCHLNYFSRFCLKNSICICTRPLRLFTLYIIRASIFAKLSLFFPLDSLGSPSDCVTFVFKLQNLACAPRIRIHKCHKV